MIGWLIDWLWCFIDWLSEWVTGRSDWLMKQGLLTSLFVLGVGKPLNNSCKPTGTTANSFRPFYSLFSLACVYSNIMWKFTRAVAIVMQWGHIPLPLNFESGYGPGYLPTHLQSFAAWKSVNFVAFFFTMSSKTTMQAAFKPDDIVLSGKNIKLYI